MSRLYEFDTLKVQGGYNSAEHNHAVSVPIYQTAAFTLGDSYRATFCGRQNLFLEDLYVRELYRGKGIGKALMRALARIALQMGAQRLDWYVLEDNKSAESFYRRLGAAPLQDRRTYRMSAELIESLANGVITNVKNQFIPSGSSD